MALHSFTSNHLLFTGLNCQNAKYSKGMTSFFISFCLEMNLEFCEEEDLIERKEALGVCVTGKSGCFRKKLDCKRCSFTRRGMCMDAEFLHPCQPQLLRRTSIH